MVFFTGETAVFFVLFDDMLLAPRLRLAGPSFGHARPRGVPSQRLHKMFVLASPPDSVEFGNNVGKRNPHGPVRAFDWAQRKSRPSKASHACLPQSANVVHGHAPGRIGFNGINAASRSRPCSPHDWIARLLQTTQLRQPFFPSLSDVCGGVRDQGLLWVVQSVSNPNSWARCSSRNGTEPKTRGRWRSVQQLHPSKTKPNPPPQRAPRNPSQSNRTCDEPKNERVGKNAKMCSALRADNVPTRCLITRSVRRTERQIPEPAINPARQRSANPLGRIHNLLNQNGFLGPRHNVARVIHLREKRTRRRPTRSIEPLAVISQTLPAWFVIKSRHAAV